MLLFSYPSAFSSTQQLAGTFSVLAFTCTQQRRAPGNDRVGWPATEWFFWRHYWRQAHPIWFRIKAHLTGFCLPKQEIPWHEAGGLAPHWLKLKAAQYQRIFGWVVELKIDLTASESNSVSPYPQDVRRVAASRGVLQGPVCLVRRCNQWHPLAVISMQNVTRGHPGLCAEQGPNPAGACTTHVEDKAACPHSQSVHTVHRCTAGAAWWHE